MPEKDEVTIQSLASSLRLFTKPIDKVELLGAKGELKWSQTVRGLKVKLPAGAIVLFFQVGTFRDFYVQCWFEEVGIVCQIN
jgi:hypothetical protein